MANEISYADPSGTTGLTIYARLRTPVNTFWNGSAFVAYSAASWATYALALTDSGGGLYLRNMPTVAAGAYYLDAYKQLGGSPASTDTLLGTTPYPMQWSGTAEVTLPGINTQVGAIAAASESVPVVDVLVEDSAPTINGFVIAMADASDVPTTFVWRGAVACFSEDGALGGGKFPIATYTRLTATTARLTFTPALPVAPADEEELQIL